MTDKSFLVFIAALVLIAITALVVAVVLADHDGAKAAITVTAACVTVLGTIAARKGGGTDA